MSSTREGGGAARKRSVTRRGLGVPLADRARLLGTETAFAVSAEASAAAAEGRKVYPFHLGDLNIPTPENIVDASLKALRDGKTGYCPNGGIPELREALASDITDSHGVRYGVENVAIQPGGKPVICKFLLTLMNPGDEVLYPNPGFPIYESLIRFFGGVPVPYTYVEEANRFALDMDGLESRITPRTRLLILNDLHNPTSAECSSDELTHLAALARDNRMCVLCDEAYFDVRFEGKSQSLASLPGMAERSVILYTFSKKFAMTGWRLGAAVGPRRIIDLIIGLNVNIESCSNHFIQWGAVEALTGDQAAPRAILATLRARRDVALDLLNSIPGVRCLKPRTTFYLYPNITEAVAMTGMVDCEAFRRAVLCESGVSMCTRQHFGHALPGERELYLRFAYSGIDTQGISEGLCLLRRFIYQHT